jgi:hypothetical protein
VIHLDPIVTLRLQRGVEQFHRLGPRATAEFLAEIACQFNGLAAMIGLLAEYERRMTPAMSHVAGGDKFPMCRLHVVP